MKKLIICLFTILILNLTSCSSKRTNVIVDRHYFGFDSKKQTISCDLFIEQISENDYLSSNGKNVINDAINNNYFSLKFIINFADSDIIQVDFLNFKDAYDGANGTPISYVDDNNSWWRPFTSKNNDTLPKSECYYSINFNIDNIDLFVYLYAMDM